MGTTLDHRRYAEECVAMAQRAADDQDKMLWLSLAQSWVRSLSKTNSERAIALRARSGAGGQLRFALELETGIIGRGLPIPVGRRG
jgi:hypothetical protein